jgi:hypothetical protein
MDTKSEFNGKVVMVVTDKKIDLSVSTAKGEPLFSFKATGQIITEISIPPLDDVESEE